MKKYILPCLMAFVLTGCSTYQYSARTVEIDRQSVGSKEIAVEIIPDYEHVVKASSDYQSNKYDAIAEAEHRCIIDNGIDVIVDPIVKLERVSPRTHKKYKATVSGFAGKYKETEAGVDAAKKYDKEDIEKYKLLSDPDFAKYYYSHGTGDTYFINSAPSVGYQTEANSLAFAPKINNKQIKRLDFTKAKRMRNAGIGLTIAGVASTFAIGIPCISAGAEGAGITFLVLGPAAVAAGIPLWCVGSKRIKNSDREMNISVGGSQSGVGLRLNF